MSPEQCRAASDVDAKTDVYALGVIGAGRLACELPSPVRWSATRFLRLPTSFPTFEYAQTVPSHQI